MDTSNLEWHNYRGRSYPKILIVYPDTYDPAATPTRDIRLLPTLPNAIDEVMQVVNLLGAHLLTGQRCDIHGLLDALAEGWDILWLVTHCDGAGWYLRDGPVPVSVTVPLVRTAGIWLTVMNTCASMTIARQVADELDTAVIATISSVPDRQAMILGTLFAQQLAAGLDYVEAFEQAQPGETNNPYRLVEARGQSDMGRDRPNAQRVEDELANIKESLRRVEAIVSGNPQWNVEGLVSTVRDLRAKVEQLIADVMTMRANQLFNRRLLIGVSLICAALLVAVAILVAQRGTL